MNGLSTRSKLHDHVSNFVRWIAPEPETREEIKSQADEVRGRISNKAEEDGVTIISTPRAGSFAKNTGLRRHMLGDSEVEGQDIDVPFVIKPLKANDYELQPMVNKFMQYANESYPATEKESSKSSVKLKFTNTLFYDLVPLFGTDDPEKQILIRASGEQIITSVQKHTEFMRNRTKKSRGKEGVVLFNECVRLMKWWREFRCSESSYVKEVPTIVMDLLCAKAFDRLSVQTTYHQTLASWCAYLAHATAKREPIVFSDYVLPANLNNQSNWNIIDPVNPENNVAQRFSSYEVDEIADWFETARDTWNRAIASDMDGDDNMSLEQIETILGSPFRNHYEE